MAENLVKFITCNAAAYAANTHDANALYFVTDTQQLYKGNVLFTGGSFAAVTALPATGVVNTLYILPDGNVSYWNGTSYTSVVKTSQTIGKNENGTWVTSDGLPTCEAVRAYVTGEVNAVKTELNTKIETVDDRVDALNTTVSGKADKATTLAGYGITNAYTKSEADSAISTAVANAGHLKRAIVDALPAVGSADANTIYMVPKTDGSGNQKYDEYMLINGAFEKVGDSAVDLTDYATKTEVSTAKTEAITTAGTNADNKITAAIQKLDVDDTAETGKYVSAVKEVDGKIQISREQLPAKPVITTGTANGTISVDGTNVAVKGLGSAAYTESSAYDAAGAATTALNSAKAYTESLLQWQSL